MPTLETVVSPYPTGAGRFIDFLFPDPNLNGQNAVGRNRIAQATTGITVTNQGGLLQSIGTSASGVDYARMQSGASGGGYEYGSIHIRTSPVVGTEPGIVYDDAQGAFRVYAVLAANAGTNAGAFDFGQQLIRIVDGTFNGVLLNAKDGIAFQLQTEFSLRLMARSGGVLTTLDIPAGSNNLSATYDNQQFHTYEWRITNATPSSVASMVWLVDGIPLTLPATWTSWAAGTLLPVSGTANGRQGWVLRTMQCAQNTALSVYAVRIIGGANQQACS